MDFVRAWWYGFLLYNVPGQPDIWLAPPPRNYAAAPIMFLIFVITLSLIITVIGEIAFKGVKVDIDSQYFKENGDHIYYDHSLIEKKTFRQKFLPINDIRTVKALLRRRSKDEVATSLEL